MSIILLHKLQSLWHAEADVRDEIEIGGFHPWSEVPSISLSRWAGDEIQLNGLNINMRSYDRYSLATIAGVEACCGRCGR